MRWFRERAGVDQLKEELEILEEEFRRTYKVFLWMGETWDQLAMLPGSAGGVCYARRQAEMFCQLADDCLSTWEEREKQYVQICSITIVN